MNAPIANKNLEPNPLLTGWDDEGQFPPFAQTNVDHFKPAFLQAMQDKRAEIAAIADNLEAPTFENTIAALDRAGGSYSRISQFFGNLLSSLSSDELRAVELELAAELAVFENEVLSNQKLFERIEVLAASVEKNPTTAAPYTEEQLELLHRFHLDFVRAGARLKGNDKERFSKIVSQLAELTARFSQNVMAEESAYELPLQESDLEGLPQFVIDSARQTAQERKSSAPFVITLSRSLVVPFLTYSTRRDLREKAFKDWTRRGELTQAHNNLPLIKEILVLRREMAQLMGYKNFADFACADRMAGTPQAAKELVLKAWAPAKQKAAAELAELTDLARAEGMTESLQAWDWRFYSEKLRAAKYNLSDEECKPYFALGNMTRAMFETANKLFGLQFKRIEGAPLYHPDVTLYEVTEQVHQGESGLVGYFLADNFARKDKSGGAWMSTYRTQTRNTVNGQARYPVISNNNNFARAADPDKSLLSLDDVRTLFHEFGHGLHGLLANVNYDRISGTNVLQDFVELPSQLFEHWGTDPQMLRQYAKHVETGAAIPEHLIEKIQLTATFDMGFSTVEYASCCLIDLELHQIDDPAAIDLSAFERDYLQQIGMPSQIVLRHRLPHFGHLFSGNYYAAGYYVYLWAEVLDADAWDAFIEAGNVFDQATAKRLRKHIYAAGASVAPMKTYLAFRGKEPSVEPMLRGRGLKENA